VQVLLLVLVLVLPAVPPPPRLELIPPPQKPQQQQLSRRRQKQVPCPSPPRPPLLSGQEQEQEQQEQQQPQEPPQEQPQVLEERCLFQEGRWMATNKNKPAIRQYVMRTRRGSALQKSITVVLKITLVFANTHQFVLFFEAPNDNLWFAFMTSFPRIINFLSQSTHRETGAGFLCPLPSTGSGGGALPLAGWLFRWWGC
jgi:hypothetical protein